MDRDPLRALVRCCLKDIPADLFKNHETVKETFERFPTEEERWDT